MNLTELLSQTTIYKKKFLIYNNKRGDTMNDEKKQKN